MWEKLKDKHTGASYFYDPVTQERREERPNEGFRLYHILFKHNQSRRPVDRSFDAALEEAVSIYRHLCSRISDHNFKDIFKSFAAKYSQCSSASRGGDLGFVCRNEMLREFEDAAFKLSRGQIVGPVSTPSGIHIIYRR